MRSILVVDDDDIFRRRLVRAFVDRGWTAHGAADLTEAREALAEASFERLVLDLRLERESGLDLLADTADLSTAVVVLTGYESIATAIQAVRSGAVNYLPKPASADEILAAFEVRVEDQPVELPPTPSLARTEWEHINRVLADCGGNISEAARRLGLHRRSLQRKLQKYPPPK